MTRSRSMTVLELDAGGLRALSGEVGPTGVAVERYLVAERPCSISAADPQAVGAWLANELRRAEIPRSRVIFALPRHDIILKQIVVPSAGPEALSEADLAGIVRLQMVRQITLSLEGTAVDFVPSPGGTVMAGALPGDRVSWWTALAQAAGIKIARLATATFGAARVLEDLAQRTPGALMGVRLSPGAVEFLVLEGGILTHSRAVEVDAAPTDPAWSDRLVVEARRTWLSFKGARAVELESLAVLGDGPDARALAEKCAAPLNALPETVRGVRGNFLPRHVPERDLPALLPLLGLLLEDAAAQFSLDFANPRRAPDRAAAIRKFALVGVLGLIVAAGLLYVVADQRLTSLRAALTEARAREVELRSDVARSLVDHARISHLEQWRASHVDWIAHLDALSQQWPSPGTATLDDLSGRMAAKSEYVPKKGYPDGAWRHIQSASFDLSGKVVDREVASDLRETMLQGDVFTVESRGADTPDKFSFRLITDLPSPADAPKKPAAKPAPKPATPSTPGQGGTK